MKSRGAAGNCVDHIYDSEARHVDVHLIVSYSPMTKQFTFERTLGPQFMDKRQVFDWAERDYQDNDAKNNLDLINEAGDQLESALRVINMGPATP